MNSSIPRRLEDARAEKTRRSLPVEIAKHFHVVDCIVPSKVLLVAPDYFALQEEIGELVHDGEGRTGHADNGKRPRGQRLRA